VCVGELGSGRLAQAPGDVIAGDAEPDHSIRSRPFVSLRSLRNRTFSPIANSIGDVSRGTSCQAGDWPGAQLSSVSRRRWVLSLSKGPVMRDVGVVCVGDLFTKRCCSFLGVGPSSRFARSGTPEFFRVSFPCRLCLVCNTIREGCVGTLRQAQRPTGNKLSDPWGTSSATRGERGRRAAGNEVSDPEEGDHRPRGRSTPTAESEITAPQDKEISHPGTMSSGCRGVSPVTQREQGHPMGCTMRCPRTSVRRSDVGPSD
jgi:hypothetical protein